MKERRKTDKALKEREHNYRILLENIPQKIFYKDINSVYLLCNHSYAKDLKIEPEEIKGKTDYDFYPKELADKYRASDKRIMQSGELKEDEDEYIRNGTKITIDTFKAPVRDEEGNIVGIFGIFWDITKRKQIEEEVERQNKFLKNVIESLPHPFYVIDANDYTIKIGNSASGLNESSKKQTCYEMTHRRSGPCADKDCLCPLEEVKRTKKPVVVDHIHYDQQGNIHYFEVYAYPIFNGAGEVYQMIEYSFDVTKRKRSEEALRYSEERYALAQRAANIGSWDWDIKTGALKWSENVEPMFGFGRGEFAATYEAFLRCVHPEDRKSVVDSVNNCIEKGEKYEIEHRIVWPDGSVRWVSEAGNVIRDADNKAVRMLGVVWDITERKKVEEILRRDKENFEKLVNERTKELLRAQNELEQAKRLSDIGTLAATVAHELRNPLGVIRTAAYNVRRKKQNSLLDRHLDNIDKKISESDQIINNLLSYSRIKMPHYEKIKIYDILEECIDSTKKTFHKHKVSIDKQYEVIKSTSIKADSFQIKEIFNNILDNAYQAMQNEKGRIEIMAQNDKNKETIKISFRDNGGGIDKEDLKKVFEPFFTKKSKGTGLGLTICNELARLHGGDIDIKSEKDKGTTVTVALPV